MDILTMDWTMISKTDWIVSAVIVALIFAVCTVSVRYRDKLKDHELEEFEKYDGYKDKEDEK